MTDKTVTFRVPQELYNKAKEKAECEDITLSQVLRRCLRRWLAEDNQSEEEPDQE